MRIKKGLWTSTLSISNLRTSKPEKKAQVQPWMVRGVAVNRSKAGLGRRYDRLVHDERHRGFGPDSHAGILS